MTKTEEIDLEIYNNHSRVWIGDVGNDVDYLRNFSN